MVKLKFIVKYIRVWLFFKPKFEIYQKSEKECKFKFKFVTRLSNPINWVVLLLMVFLYGIIEMHEDFYGGLGEWYTIEYQYKEKYNWLHRKWIDFQMIYRMALI